MRKIKLLLAIISIMTFFTFSKCKKDTTETLTSQLPDATQEGKNTLGFLLNGQPWKPQGNNGTANLSIDFDSGVDNGVCGISSYRLQSSSMREYFAIGIKDSLNFYTAPFTIVLTNSSICRFYFSNAICTFFSTDTDTHVAGSMTISKLDRANRIISGTFSATLNKIGCTEIKITNGRLDMKY